MLVFVNECKLTTFFTIFQIFTELFSYRGRVSFSKGGLFLNKERVLNSRGGLLCRRTDLETTPLFWHSYTDVLMKQRRCFKLPAAKHKRGGGKAWFCRRQKGGLPSAIFCSP